MDEEMKFFMNNVSGISWDALSEKQVGINSLKKDMAISSNSICFLLKIKTNISSVDLKKHIQTQMENVPLSKKKRILTKDGCRVKQTC